ncbi:hypothetical protein COCOBI_11-1240 [Coccomyxa sp. Obi]|nr:hypothetical protein COCOBI_11-1240 [Coccomyxa sp. Obi]
MASQNVPVSRLFQIYQVRPEECVRHRSHASPHCSATRAPAFISLAHDDHLILMHPAEAHTGMSVLQGPAPRRHPGGRVPRLRKQPFYLLLKQLGPDGSNDLHLVVDTLARSDRIDELGLAQVLEVLAEANYNIEVVSKELNLMDRDMAMRDVMEHLINRKAFSISDPLQCRRVMCAWRHMVSKDSPAPHLFSVPDVSVALFAAGGIVELEAGEREPSPPVLLCPAAYNVLEATYEFFPADTLALLNSTMRSSPMTALMAFARSNCSCDPSRPMLVDIMASHLMNLISGGSVIMSYLERLARASENLLLRAVMALPAADIHDAAKLCEALQLLKTALQWLPYGTSIPLAAAASLEGHIDLPSWLSTQWNGLNTNAFLADLAEVLGKSSYGTAIQATLSAALKSLPQELLCQSEMVSSMLEESKHGSGSEGDSSQQNKHDQEGNSGSEGEPGDANATTLLDASKMAFVETPPLPPTAASEGASVLSMESLPSTVGRLEAELESATHRAAVAEAAVQKLAGVCLKLAQSTRIFADQLEVAVAEAMVGITFQSAEPHANTDT